MYLRFFLHNTTHLSREIIIAFCFVCVLSLFIYISPFRGVIKFRIFIWTDYIVILTNFLRNIQMILNRRTHFFDINNVKRTDATKTSTKQ